MIGERDEHERRITCAFWLSRLYISYFTSFLLPYDCDSPRNFESSIAWYK